MTDQKVKALVQVDRLRYLDDDGALQSASKGDVVELTKADFDRRGDAVAKAGKGADQPPEPNGEKSVDQMTGAELDAKAAEAAVENWDASARVAEKKATLQAWLDSHPA